jgi:hypothetical protein
MDCPGCGTSIEAGEVECSACETTIALSDVIPSDNQLVKLRILQEWDGLDELLRQTPSDSSWTSASVAKITVGLLIVLMAIVTLLLFKHLDSVAQIVLAFFYLLGGASLIREGSSCLGKMSESALERLPSVVLGKAEGSTSIPGRHLHYVALLTAGEEKKALRVRGALLKKLEKGDAGVAYARGEYLLDFKRVTLPEA